MSDRARDGAYDDWLDAVEAGEAYALACPNDHHWLPPRRVCPACTSRDLTERPIPESGDVVSYTRVFVPTPPFDEDAPYVTAIAEFGPVSVTGIVRGVDAEAVAVGTSVALEVGRRETTDDRLVVLRGR